MWRRRQVSLLLPMLVVVAAASGNTPPSSILDCGESCGQDGNNLCIPSQQCKMKVSVKPGEECQAPCICCRLRPACTTHTTKSCSRYQGGQCKSSCKLNERVTAGKCKEGSTCQCCAEPCKAKKLCTNAQGFCVQDRKDCASGKIKTKGCKGYGCLCCIPKSCTSYTTTSCLMYEGGHCKSSCGQNERVTSAICNEGNTCKCCAKPCKSKKLCTQVNGFCVQDKNDCGNGTLNMRGCQGYGCLCCIPKRGLVTTAKLSLLTTAVRTVTIPPTPPKQPTTTEIIITQIPSSTEGESKEELTTEEATTDAPSTVSLSTKVLSTDVQSEVPYTIVSTEIPSKASSTELPTAEVITEKDSSTEVTIDIPQTEDLTTEYVTNVPSAVEPSTEIQSIEEITEILSKEVQSIEMPSTEVQSTVVLITVTPTTEVQLTAETTEVQSKETEVQPTEETEVNSTEKNEVNSAEETTEANSAEKTEVTTIEVITEVPTEAPSIYVATAEE
ncbi:uncharacterized protein [Cherax quadricarinatus]|uniref:uncharacterized protein n=1 Tax=Cherax quadricarinatus TaxID=27406 RepID=UPI00387E31EA